MTDVNEHTKVEMGSERGFGLVFSGVFAVISVWPLVFGGGGERWWAVAVAIVFLLLAYLAPSRLKPLNRIWFRFGMILAKIITPIMMGLIFALSIVPIGLIRRITNPDALNQKLDPKLESYWIERDQEQLSASSMRKQF